MRDYAPYTPSPINLSAITITITPTSAIEGLRAYASKEAFDEMSKWVDEFNETKMKLRMATEENAALKAELKALGHYWRIKE